MHVQYVRESKYVLIQNSNEFNYLAETVRAMVTPNDIRAVDT